MNTIIAPEPLEAHPFAGEHPLSGVFTPSHLAIPDVTQYDHHKVVQGVPIASRYNNLREITEMTAFCDQMALRGLSGFVQGVFYDSKSDTCLIGFHDPLEASDEIAQGILATALDTITQFDWFGYVKHGKPYNDELERFVREYGLGTRGDGTEQGQGTGKFSENTHEQH